MVRGDGPSPALVISAINALPHESLTVALMRGGRQYYGWTQDTELSAALYDAININTAATGNFKKKPKIEPFPRPKDDKKDDRITGKSVSDLHKKFAMLPGAKTL